MAIIVPPQGDFVPLQSGISVNAGSQVAASGAAIGKSQQEGAQLLSQNAQNIANMSQRYFDEAKSATDTAEYSEAMNLAIVQMAKSKDQRYNQTVDQDGRPSFASLHDDIVNSGKDISGAIKKNLKSPLVAQKFQESFDSLMTNNQVEALSVARKQQEDYVTAQSESSFKTLGNMAAVGSSLDAFAGANEYHRQIDSLVASGAMSNVMAQRKKADFTSWVSENRAKRWIQMSPEAAMAALAPEANPDALSGEAISLDEDQRQGLFHQAQQAVNARIRTVQAAEAARVDSIKDLYSETDRLIERGGVPDNNVLQTLKSAAQGTVMGAKISELEDKAQRVTTFSSLSSVDREAVLNKMKSTGQLTDDFELYSRINGNLQTAQNKDIYSLAISQRVIAAPQPLDVNGNIQTQLASRRQSAAMVKGHYGQGSVGVTNEEMEALIEKSNSLGPSDKAKFYGQIVGGLGSSSLDLFSKMAKSGSRSEALVGVLVLNGRQDTASKVLIGKQLLKEGQLKLAPNFNKETAASIEDVLPPTGNAEFVSDVVDMAKAIYAQKTVTAKDYSQEFERDRWEDSLRESIGGDFIDISAKNSGFFEKDYKIVPPVQGMDAKGFQNWVSTISDSDIESTGGWQGWTSGMSKQLQNAKFEQVGFGKYAVLLPSKMSDKNYSNVFTKSGKLFTIDYEQIRDIKSGASLKDIPTLTPASPRIDDVIKTLTRTPKAALDTSSVHSIAESAASKYGVDPKLVKAVIHQESGGKAGAVSPKGASGLMQLMPATAKELGVTDIFDPKQNIEAGTKYLSQLLKRYDGDISKTLAAYNAGPGAVDKVGGVPNWKETKNYVKSITAKLNMS